MGAYKILHSTNDLIKSKNFCNNDWQYSQYFSRIKNDPIKFIEFGVLDGDSIKAWEDYFPNAEIYGVDTNIPPGLEFERAKILLGDLDDPSFRAEILDKTGGSFDVIIDDADHRMDQQKMLFETFFMTLNDGGLYIIEDLYTSYWPSHFGGGYKNPDSTMEYLKGLTDTMNADAYKRDERCSPDSPNLPFTWTEENIYSMHFYRGACLIFKGKYH